MDGARVEELIGVYDADGTLRGELRYLVGTWRGTAHCDLCDITHGRLRQKSEFRALRADLPVPFDLVHRDERAPDVAEFTAQRVPCVVARVDGALVEVLDRAALAACGGDVARFATALRAALDELAIHLPD